jgi:hypothetical protein
MLYGIVKEGELRLVLDPDSEDPSWDRVGALPEGVNPDFATWDGSAIVSHLSRLENDLVALVKLKAEELKMAAITPGFAKANEYEEKAAEARASSTVSIEDLNALSTEDAFDQYPQAKTESSLTGETLSVVLDRYREGIASSGPTRRRLAAIESKAVIDIRAALTAVDKQEAFDNVDWEWEP